MIKKFILIFIAFFTFISFNACSQTDTTITAIEAYSLDLEFNNNTMYNLDTGLYNSDISGYATTSRESVYGANIYVNNYNYSSYALFWSDNNEYIGYKTLNSNYDSGIKYLGDENDNTILIPDGASKVVFMIENGITLTNLIEYPDFTDPLNTDGLTPINWYDYTGVALKYSTTYDDLRVDCNSTNNCKWGYDVNSAFIVDHQYYLQIKFNEIGFNYGGNLTISTYNAVNNFGVIKDELFYNSYPASTYGALNISSITTIVNSGQYFIHFDKDDTSANTCPDSRIDEVNLYDLTDTYGEGLEPNIDDFEEILDLGGVIGVDYLDFINITASYNANITVYEDDTFIENIEESLEYATDDSEYILVFVVIGILLITIIALAFYKADIKIIIFIGVLEILLFTLINWIDTWISLITGIILFILLFLKLSRRD